MSVKRRATTDLNHQNWDQEEKNDEEMGSFNTASEDVLEKRVIKIAKRRNQNVGEEVKKPVFSGFGGFNKTQPSSFDFLANLTNGSNTNTSTPATTMSSPPSVTNPFGGMSTGGIFTSPTSSNNTKFNFGKTTNDSLSVFKTPTSTAPSSIFSSNKADSTVNDNPFKAPVTSKFAASSFNSKSPEVSSSQVSSTIFGVASSSSNITNKSLFTSSTSTPFQVQTTSNASPLQVHSQTPTSSAPQLTPLLQLSQSKAPQQQASQLQTTNNTLTRTEVKTNESNTNSENMEKRKSTYYSKLTGLNESVLDWIKKYVEETPLCILTPIFDDYKKYLKEIQDEYENKKDEREVTNNNTPTTIPKQTPPDKTPVTTIDHSKGSFFTSPSVNTSKSIFGNAVTSTTQSSNFSFGFTSSPSTNSTSTGFSFGVSSTQSTATTTSPFAVSNLDFMTNKKGPFSFGIGKPFTFKSNLQPDTQNTNDNTEEDEQPPKVEFTPVVEEDSVFDKRCKIFVKKDGNFVDKGVGTLYVKKIKDSEKHQLLVRANTNLGTVLLNLVLSSSIPTQRMGKNNVMLVCIPTPETNPPPVPILIRVKTPEEADNLLNTLNKYKA